MKKTTILLTLLLCGLFNTMSAQAILRWSISAENGSVRLKIKAGTQQVDVQLNRYDSPQSGILTDIADGDLIEYEATCTDNSAPILCAATETDLVDGWIASCFDSYGNYIDPYIFSEYGSWYSNTDFDYTIHLSTPFP